MMDKSILFKSFVVCAPLLMVLPARCDKGADLIYSQKSDMKDGEHTSPDGKFVVVSKTGDGEYVRITLRGTSKPSRIIYQYDSIDGFAWLPGHQHSLVFAHGLDSQTPGLFLWQGGKRPRLIKGSKRHSNENFGLIGVSHDAHKIAYYYWPNLMDTNKKTFGPFIKSMRLP